MFYALKAISVGLLAISLSGCVSSVLDVDNKASQPIPALLVAEMSRKLMSPSSPILVRIFKQESELEIWKQDRTGKYALLKTYPMCRWSGKLGPKTREGDRQAPEGLKGTVMGTAQSTSSLARIAGPALAGLALEHIDVTAQFWIGFVILIPVLFMILALGRSRVAAEQGG